MDRLPCPIAFRTIQARNAFAAEWLRRCGERFRPRRIQGEAHGYWLRDSWDLERAIDIARTVPGVLFLTDPNRDA